MLKSLVVLLLSTRELNYAELTSFTMPKTTKSKGKKASKRPWQTIAKEAQDHRDATIALLQPPIPQIPQHVPSNVLGLASTLLPEDENKLWRLPIHDLLTLLASGEVSSYDVTLAFLKRAGVAQSLVSLLNRRMD